MAKTRDRLRVIFITSVGHSGSTLLDLLISAHPAVVSTGEAKNLVPARTPRIRCACPALLVECPFWRRVGETLERRSGLPLERLDLMHAEQGEFERQNLAFFETVAELSGKRIIVDSSKNIDRLERLLTIPALDVRTIHLIRRAQGVVHSHIKKGRPWVEFALSYGRRVRYSRRVLRAIDHALVRYEALAQDPPRVLGALMPRLGLDFDPTQLEWAGRERHDCGGNRMRRSESSEILLDRAWKRELGLWRRLGIALLTARART